MAAPEKALPPAPLVFEDPTLNEADEEDGEEDSSWDGFHEALDELQVRTTWLLVLPLRYFTSVGVLFYSFCIFNVSCKV